MSERSIKGIWVKFKRGWGIFLKKGEVIWWKKVRLGIG